jgi:hypothetical protein
VRQLVWVAERLHKCGEEGAEIRKLALPFSYLHVIVRAAKPLHWAQWAAQKKLETSQTRSLRELQEAIDREEGTRSPNRQRRCGDCRHKVATAGPKVITLQQGRQLPVYLCSWDCAAKYARSKDAGAG